MRLQHTEHPAVGAYDADFGHTNAVIDSNLKTALLLTRIEAGTAHRHVDIYYLRRTLYFPRACSEKEVRDEGANHRRVSGWASIEDGPEIARRTRLRAACDPNAVSSKGRPRRARGSLR